MNVLLVGLDTGAGGNNTDTLMVASVDPESNRIVMISLPRDTVDVELYDGRIYTRKINTFMNFAARNPKEFPEGPMIALVRQMEHLIGVPIDYYASVDIAGFRRMIELVDGVELNVEKPIHDRTYKLGIGPEGFHLEPGVHQLNSWEVLAYVRSRKGAGGSDFERARRQQQVLLALRHKMDDPHVLANLPALLDAASETIRTNIPPEELPQLMALLQGTLEAETENYVLGPPKYSQRVPPTEIRGLYALRLDMEAVAGLSRSLFGEASRYAQR
jgi:polyisoprenyl-teichoic acid--peptidoglycan teichoic acid transferase